MALFARASFPEMVQQDHGTSMSRLTLVERQGSHGVVYATARGAASDDRAGPAAKIQAEAFLAGADRAWTAESAHAHARAFRADANFWKESNDTPGRSDDKLRQALTAMEVFLSAAAFLQQHDVRALTSAETSEIKGIRSWLDGNLPLCKLFQDMQSDSDSESDDEKD